MSKYQQIINSANHLDWYDWQELWRRRELLAVLVKRDLKVRYKNTTLGVVWVVLQPLLSTIIFTFVFARLLQTGAANQNNYLISTFIGFTFWQFFSGSLNQAASSIYEQIGIVKKIYFPRLYLPLTVVLRSFFDFCIGSIFLALLMLVTHTPFTGLGFFTFWLVAFTLVIFTSGCSFIFSALNARFRDFRHLTTFILQIWLYATPVFYPASFLENTPLAFLNFCNPLAQFLQLVRQAVFENTFSLPTFALLFFSSLLIWYFGFWLFKKMETIIVDWT